MEGWIKLHRQIVNWEWYNDMNTFKVFLHLVLTANHKDNNWRGIEIKRGQCLTGRKVLSEKLEISEQSIRSALNKLKSTNEVTIKSTSRYSLITINNYNAYNDNNQLSNQENNQQSNQQITNDQPGTNQQATTNKNDSKKEKKEKKEKKGNDVLSPLQNLWNEKTKRLPKVKANSQARREKEKLRLKQYDLHKWDDIFTSIDESNFCCGLTDENKWKASYDWIMSTENNAIKVLEGNYANASGQKQFDGSYHKSQ